MKVDELQCIHLAACAGSSATDARITLADYEVYESNSALILQDCGWDVGDRHAVCRSGIVFRQWLVCLYDISFRMQWLYIWLKSAVLTRE